MSVKDTLRHLTQRKKRKFVAMATAFMHNNKDVLIMIADPETDVIITAYKDFCTTARIVNDKGKKMNLINNVLRCSTSKRHYEFYMNSFLHYVDGSVFNISKEINTRGKKKGRPLSVEYKKANKFIKIKSWLKKQLSQPPEPEKPDPQKGEA